MTVKINADGTTAPGFSIGIGGPTILHGTTIPSPLLGVDGDVYLRHGDNPAQYQKVSGDWISFQQAPEDFIRASSPMGLTTIINIATDYHAITTGSATTTNLTLPTGYEGKQIIIKNETALSQAINISPTSGDTVEGSGYRLAAAYASITLIFHSGWQMIRQIGAIVL